MLLVLPTAAALAVPVPAAATMLSRTTIEQAALSAQTVFVGTVVGTRVESGEGGVRTAVTLWVDESLKGDAAGTTTVFVPGGELPDGSSVTVDAMAQFSPGEVCCVFVDARGWVLGGYQGKVSLGSSELGAASTSGAPVVARVRAALVAAGAQPAEPQVAVAEGEVFSAASQPVVSYVTPGSASSGTNSSVTIVGSGFGPAPGKVEFALNVYGIARVSAETISSWTDTQIVCEVPAASIGGMGASAGSGPMYVTNAGGIRSNPYEFRVPFGYSSKKWPSATPTYLVNPAGGDVARREQLVDAGAASWSGARSAFAFVDGGLTSLGAARDGQNVICWSNTVPEGVVALTRTYSDAAGQIQECDIQFNSRLAWTDGLAANSSDIQSIAVHELGHWLCLLDQYADGDLDKIMYGFLLPGQNRELSLGDIQGIRSIYPAPSGSLAGTVRDFAGVPIAGAVVAVETCEPVVTAPDGSFEVSAVPSGVYQAGVTHPGHTAQLWAATIVAGEVTLRDVKLSPGQPTPVYRFYHRRNGSHFYTASAAERDRVIAKLSRTYTYEGIAYEFNAVDAANSTPLYRFFNKRNGSHFYTASLAERDRVRSKLYRTYTYEGVAYNVGITPSVVALPVYRFFKKKGGSHFYTGTAIERNRVIRDLGAVYTYEGTGFHVTP